MSTLQNDLIGSHIGATALFGFRGDVMGACGKRVARAADPPVVHGGVNVTVNQMGQVIQENAAPAEEAAAAARRAQSKLSLSVGSGASGDNWQAFSA